MAGLWIQNTWFNIFYFEISVKNILSPIELY